MAADVGPVMRLPGRTEIYKEEPYLHARSSALVKVEANELLPTETAIVPASDEVKILNFEVFEHYLVVH